MAFIERFVTDAAGGGGAGTEGDPWTLAEALTNAAAGDRVNILSDSGYSLGADAVTNAGTALDLIVFRGYDATIGDLQNPGRSSTTGKLDTTGFPIITLTGTLTPNAFVAFQNIAFTGALSTFLVGSSVLDDWGMVECEIINSQNNASAGASRGDNNCYTISSDFECSGATHNIVADFDSSPKVINCRIKAIGGPGIQTASIAIVVGTTFVGGASATVAVNDVTGTAVLYYGNTIYNWDTAFQFPNNAPQRTPSLINNHVTDCAKYIDGLYVATDSIPIIEVNNRTRDNTTPRTGVGDGVLSGEVTTDTGGAETDFTNAGADDLSLIAAAPGREVALGSGSPDIGSWQGAAGAGGGGGPGWMI